MSNRIASTVPTVIRKEKKKKKKKSSNVHTVNFCDWCPASLRLYFIFLNSSDVFTLMYVFSSLFSSIKRLQLSKYVFG